MKKLILIFAILFSMIGFAQQNSSLQKGLIFHAPLDEDYPSTDLVSGTKGTITSVYPVLDRQGSGRREYSFNGSTNYVALPTIPAFGTGDFTVVMKFKTNVLSGTQALTHGLIGAASMYITSTGEIGIYSSNVGGGGVSTSLITTGIDYILTYKRSGITGTFYINGISFGTITDSNNYYGVTSVIGKNLADVQFFSGSISMCRIFNYALSPTQIANYSKPEYPIEWVDRGATGAELVTNGGFTDGSSWTTGTGVAIGSGTANFTSATGANLLYQNVGMVVGKSYNVSYTIPSISSGGIYAIYGGSSQNFTTRSSTGTYFETKILEASGNRYLVFYGSGTLNCSIDNVSVIQAGCILDLNAEGATSAYWYDKTNSLTATVSGASLIKPSASNLGASYFNGTSSNIAFGDVQLGTALDLGIGDFTINLWIRQNKLDGFNSFLAKYAGAANGFDFESYGNTYALVIRNPVVILPMVDNALNNLNKWTHIVICRGNGVAYSYINNVYQGSIACTNNITNNESLYIGERSEADIPFNGNISDLRIYSRILSADEIQGLYQGMK